MSFRKSISAIAVFLAALYCLLGAATAMAKAEGPGKGKTINPVWGNIAEEWFQNEVIFIGFRELGYKVADPHEVEIPSAHLAVGMGDADFYASHWEPMHNAFYEKVGGDEKVSRVGVLADGALQGYLIDKKTAEEHNITSIEQLKDPKIAKLFDTDGNGKANLTGCTPGWGCERVIEHHMDAYKLRDSVDHNQGTYFALMADTISRYKAGKPILYYTWTPLWLSSELAPGKDVEWLTVPFTSLPKGEEGEKTNLPDGRNVGFTVNKIRILANKDFLEKDPVAARFLEVVQIPIDDISAQNLKMHEGESSMKDIRRHAEEWVKAHRAEFDGWLEEARKAAK